MREAASAFVDAYVAYTYAQEPARSIPYISPGLRGQLEASPPNVPRAVRERHPVVLSVSASPAGDATARVYDGELAYRIRFKMAHSSSGWEAASITP